VASILIGAHPSGLLSATRENADIDGVVGVTTVSLPAARLNTMLYENFFVRLVSLFTLVVSNKVLASIITSISAGIGGEDGPLLGNKINGCCEFSSSNDGLRKNLIFESDDDGVAVLVGSTDGMARI
jgi:hypothetical protein